MDPVNVKVNGPDKVYDKNESNNSSLITSINYKNTNYLFAGDIENARIKDYLSKYKDEYDLIKIPYHGNYQKRLDDLLNITNPKYTIITSNIVKDIASTIDLLDSMKIKYYITGNGDVDVYSDGDSIIIKQ